MAGSDGFRRTKQQQENFPAKTADRQALAQVAIVYRDRQTTIYRNSQPAASYTAESAERFGNDAKVLMGLRHTDAGLENRFFTGSIDDARVYGAALTAEQIAALKPNQPSNPQPLAWWDFENGSAADRMKTFPVTTLFGEARIADGRLHLNAHVPVELPANGHTWLVIE